MKKLNTFTALLCSAILSSSPLQADELKKAIRLYEDGMLGTVVEIEHPGFTARYCAAASF